MEVLGAVSSVFAVVSLAGQLSSNIQNLLEFWDSVKDAPAEVAQIKSQLQVLSLLLKSIEEDEERTTKNTLPHLGTECLSICFASVAKLQKFSVELDRGLNKSGAQRRWTSLKKAMRDMELRRYWEELERAKTLLILYQGMRNSQRHDSIMSAISSMPLSRQKETSNVSKGTISSPSNRHLLLKKVCLTSRSYEFHLSFGTIRIRVSTYDSNLVGDPNLPRNNASKGRVHKNIKASFVPGYFLQSMLEWSVTRGYCPWSLTFKTFNLRPDWSPIFRDSCSGNMRAVREMIENGLASPTDINSEGMTPLHFAATFHHYELCRMLIDLGAATKAMTHRFESPLEMALDEKFRVGSARSEEQKGTLNETSQLDTVRLLVQSGQNDPMEVDDIGFTPFLIGLSNPLSSGLKWLLKQDKFDINLHYKTPTGHTAAAYMSVREDLSAEMLMPLIRSGIEVNAPCADFFYFRFRSRIRGPTMLQYTVWVWYDRLITAVDQNHLDQLPPYPLGTIKTLLDHGADIHALSASGHTILDGILLNFIRFDGYPYRYETLRRCKVTWKGIIHDLGIHHREYMGREREIHRSTTPHDLGLGLHMEVQFTKADSEQPQWFWSGFQGIEERNENMDLYRYSVTECQIWKAWQLNYAIPKRPDYSRRNKFLSRPTEIVVLKSHSVGSSEDTPSEVLSEPVSPPSRKTFPFPVERIICGVKYGFPRQLARLCRYRHEFSLYLFLFTSILGCGYLARFWMTWGFYILLNYMQDVIS